MRLRVCRRDEESRADLAIAGMTRVAVHANNAVRACARAADDTVAYLLSWASAVLRDGAAPPTSAPANVRICDLGRALGVKFAMQIPIEVPPLASPPGCISFTPSR